MSIRKHAAHIAVVTLTPLLAWAAITVRPTFDDWVCLVSPATDALTLDYLRPQGTFWRPLDALVGQLVGTDLSLFPTLNHLIVIAGHLLNTLMVYALARRLSFSRTAAQVAMMFFFLSAATLGVVYSVDSINQTYAQCFGLLALFLYLRRPQQPWWLLLAVMATLSKENGIGWLAVCPLFALGMGFITRKQFWHSIAWAAATVALYAACRLALDTGAEVDASYLTFSLTDRLKDVVQLIAYTLLPLDYVALFCPDGRTWLPVVITLLLALPFVTLLFWQSRRQWFHPTALTLVACMLLLVLPHLLTLVSIMHNYAWLAMAALLVAFLFDQSEQRRLLLLTFSLWLMAALWTQWTHWKSSYESGEVGHRMAIETLNKCYGAPDRVFCIILDHGEQRYSSFCVIPYEAFGWGLSVPFYTGYEWPKHVADTIMPAASAPEVPSLMRQKFREGYSSVWLVEGQTVEVFSK